MDVGKTAAQEKLRTVDKCLPIGYDRSNDKDDKIHPQRTLRRIPLSSPLPNQWPFKHEVAMAKESKAARVRVFFGEITHEKNKSLPDASARERWILLTMAAVTLWMGVGSAFITNRTARSSQTVIDQVNPQRIYEGKTHVAPAVNAPATNSPNGHAAASSTAAPVAAITPALVEQIPMERRATR